MERKPIPYSEQDEDSRLFSRATWRRIGNVFGREADKTRDSLQIEWYKGIVDLGKTAAEAEQVKDVIAGINEHQLSFGDWTERYPGA